MQTGAKLLAVSSEHVESLDFNQLQFTQNRMEAPPFHHFGSCVAKSSILSDAFSLHVEQADEAICLGPIEHRDGNPHQNMELLIATALRVEADSIHPGYGYLSENSNFAEKVIAANLIFIGPTPHTISVLGDKRSAKAVLRQDAPSVPLIPGYSGAEQDVNTLILEADKIGYPVMIKASAGGGGKGMRIVHAPKFVQEELSRAKSEAHSLFGSSDCILEKYIQTGKHIEVQIFGDKHGRVLSLFERDCSIQRRHQKVIEESPASWVSSELRERICNVAVQIGELLHYEGAGTVEFMVDIQSSDFYFLEVNTRIQVEHPITEAVTCIDIVALQFFVAAGGRLDDIKELQNITQKGHAIECRMCAEDPNRDFVPDLGKVWRWNTANELQYEIPGVRYDTAIRTGSEVSIHFDSMIAKIIVWAPTRSMAIQRMLHAVANTVCIGPRTNQQFLQSCISHPAFKKIDYSTNFIPEYIDELLANPYLRDVDSFLKSTAIIPSFTLGHFHLQSSMHFKRPFSTISSGFRNQTKDSSNTPADIISVQGAKGKLSNLLVRTSRQLPSSTIYTIQDLSQPSEDISQPKILGAGAQLATHFQHARDLMHDCTTTKQKCVLRKLVGGITRCDTGNCLLVDAIFLLNGQQLSAHIASDSTFDASDQGTFNRIFIHFPSLGTNFEFHRYSLLTYHESMRANLNSPTTGQRSMRAPMPCKVKRVLKSAGDEVQKGEILVVVESMKMELKVVADFDGTFAAEVAIGDAVQEGQILCRIL